MSMISIVGIMGLAWWIHSFLEGRYELETKFIVDGCEHHGNNDRQECLRVVWTTQHGWALAGEQRHAYLLVQELGFYHN